MLTLSRLEVRYHQVNHRLLLQSVTLTGYLCNVCELIPSSQRHGSAPLPDFAGHPDLKSNERIDAFAFLGYIAVLVHALIERELRRAMRDADLAQLPLYPEDRACKGPTAARVIEIFEPLCAHELVENDRVLRRYDPTLSKLHRQILDLLEVPATAYQAAQTTPR